MNDLGNLTGATLEGRYRVDRLIAETPLTAVYKTWDVETARVCALKLLYGHRAGHGGDWRKQARMLGQVQHVNVCRVHNIGILRADAVESGHAITYIDMEYIDGPNLIEYARSMSLSTDQRIQLFASVCRGLEAVHATGLVHLDLKPSNVLVDLDSGEAKLIDFGLAKGTEPLADARSYLGSQGTPIYAAPEQLHPDERTSERSDIYALGMLLYELLRGETPYAFPRDPTQWNQMRTIVDGYQVDALDVNVHPRLLGVCINEVVRTAMSKAPLDRYSAEELRQAVELCADKPYHKPDPTRSQPLNIHDD